jgi:hypothetical protein
VDALDHDDNTWLEDNFYFVHAQNRKRGLGSATRNRAREPVNRRATVAAPRKEPSLRGGVASPPRSSA